MFFPKETETFEHRIMIPPDLSRDFELGRACG
jgi:hypothetical protein